MKRFVIGGVACAASFIGAVATAQPGPAPSTSSPARHRASFFTSNQNRTDVTAHVERLFKGLDVNRDGFVTKDEIASLQARFDDRMTKGAPKRAARMFDRMDSNHDGRVTQAEIDAARTARLAAKGKTAKAGRPSSLFVRADGNKDGVITRAEYDAAIASKLRHANMRGSSIVRLFDAADTNHDGRLSLDEAQQASLHQFDAADLNRDGMLTPDERRQASKARRKTHLAS